MTNRHSNPNLRSRTFLVAGFLVVSSLTLLGQSVQHLSRPFIGGMSGLPVVTGIEPGSNSVTVTWDGPSGYYQLLMQTAQGGTWQALGKATNASRRATVSMLYSNAFFRVCGPAPKYIGAQACMECHRGVHNSVLNTAHANAFSSPAFAASGGQTNASCLSCHTVGFELPSGFTDIAKTPKLAGVQCESCHGPGAVHAANPDDPIYRPRVEIAATLCGGCHTASQDAPLDNTHVPVYEEWAASAHAVVTEDMNPSSRISNCGRCHSGSVRDSLVKGKPLPTGDANVAIGCVTCHEPHKNTANPAQLRYPLASLKDFSLTSADFAQQHDPTINVCGQCHNDRGVSWESSARPPHHSPQYNMLVGTAGETSSGLPTPTDWSHAEFIPNQCVGCHMQKSEFQTEAHPASTGHSFKVESYGMCVDCHPFPELLADIVGNAVSMDVQFLKFALDLWATTKAPEALRVKYGARAWEYTAPGSLSTGGPGPNATEQAQIPENIKKARLNLYLVLYDGSFGVHNPSHTAELLYAAEKWVDAEMKK